MCDAHVCTGVQGRALTSGAWEAGAPTTPAEDPAEGCLQPSVWGPLSAAVVRACLPLVPAFPRLTGPLQSFLVGGDPAAQALAEPALSSPPGTARQEKLGVLGVPLLP